MKRRSGPGLQLHKTTTTPAKTKPVMVAKRVFRYGVRGSELAYDPNAALNLARPVAGSSPET